MDVVGKIKSLLEENDMWYEEFHHEPVRTSEEAAKTRPEYSLSQGAKALILSAKLKGGERKYVMLVLPGDKRIDGKLIKKLLNAKSTSFATPEQVEEITGGVKPGGVPPFGNLFNLDVYVDKSLAVHKKIVFNAGSRSVSIGMKYDDFLALVRPIVSSFTE